MSTSSFIYSSYERFFSLVEEEYCLIGKTIPLPTFPETTYHHVAQEALSTFMKCPTMIDLSGEIMIVGDIHGNIVDLIRVLIQYKKLNSPKLLFLGDYVDRGNFSIEVISLLFAMKNLFPDTVHLLRGNHEFKAVNLKYGFYDECIQFFGNGEFFNECNRAFNYMPLAALVNEKMFCVHGGICKNLRTISQVREIQRGIDNYDDELIYGMMWSDPCETTSGFVESTRGAVAFGLEGVRKFLARNNLTKIIRGHQMVPHGVCPCASGHVVTVFSCSNYGPVANLCGIIISDNSDNLLAYKLPCILQFKRSDARFISCAQKTTINLRTSHCVMTKMGKFQCKCKHSLPNLGAFTSTFTGSFKDMSLPPLIPQDESALKSNPLIKGIDNASRRSAVTRRMPIKLSQSRDFDTI
ncbi:Ser/Thr protein phosphatase [Tritrichomonas foetus]|uniref:Serine/threonine-protein phosphatase n=1 Tax=Tritrichomonas foetus TaxID=1144522 RepID=A0A1J4KCZ1_9EUKA|nr:Ser/Thr protein phosphatase [Tritrichomonas foetus]|eukprot:OHT09083.1 Ser/Thr protein phosphatase [Tritrichomonas foetus]